MFIEGGLGTVLGTAQLSRGPALTLLLAGLYDIWTNQLGEEEFTYTIFTTKPCKQIVSISLLPFPFFALLDLFFLFW